MKEQRQQQQQIISGRRSISLDPECPGRTQRIVAQFQSAGAIVEMNELELKNVLDDYNELRVRYDGNPEHLRRSRDR